MARIRTIKPEFFTSEDIVSLTPFARLLYVALWCEADRDGRMQWKPRTFKMRYLPADDINIDELCDELLDANLVVLYGGGLAYIPRFENHQHINPREAASSLPDPHASSTRRARVDDATVTVQAPSVTHREEGKGKEVNNTDDSASPSGFAEFWIGYPKKVGKGAAEKAFRRAKIGAPLLPNILQAIERARSTEQWRKDNGQFIPNPATWLNERRWEDGAHGCESIAGNSLFAGVL